MQQAVSNSFIQALPQAAEAAEAPLLTHRVGDSADVLLEIQDPRVNLSLWRRSLQTPIEQELRSLAATDLPDVRHGTSPETFSEDLVQLFYQLDLNPMGFKNLRSDLCQLMGLFASFSGSPPRRFRLATTDENDCRRFHLDRTPLRLICTYQGPGTEWLAEDQVDRAAYERGAPNEEIMRHGEPCQFATFWVGIMKGDPAKTGVGLIHRSPVIEGSGQIRVVFCLDN